MLPRRGMIALSVGNQGVKIERHALELVQSQTLALNRDRWTLLGGRHLQDPVQTCLNERPPFILGPGHHTDLAHSTLYLLVGLQLLPTAVLTITVRQAKQHGRGQPCPQPSLHRLRNQHPQTKHWRISSMKSPVQKPILRQIKHLLQIRRSSLPTAERRIRRTVKRNGDRIVRTNRENYMRIP